MLPFDPPVFHFLNANAQSPLWWIQASRFASNWLPTLCALPVIAAMLTPTPDVVNMLMMGGPLYLLYEAGIVIMMVMRVK